jgi:hypothetical protein
MPLEVMPCICESAGMTFEEIRDTLESAERVPDAALRRLSHMVMHWCLSSTN